VTGHGHVTPNPDGVKARCGGPALCGVCAKEQAAAQHAAPCGRCHGSEWMCSAHPDLTWRTPQDGPVVAGSCGCGATGVPCPACHPATAGPRVGDGPGPIIATEPPVTPVLTAAKAFPFIEKEIG
jgi:hypothetical protein